MENPQLSLPEFPLNADQQAAADGFFAFLFSKDKELRISGPGGVGKTYLMGYLIDRIMQQYFDACKLAGIEPEYFDVYMTATTNKAAEVLGQNTGRPTSTVHSQMNLKVIEDFETGKARITKTKQWEIHQGIILFVDEASMVDRKLLEFIREGTMKSKIVYVGDKCQLAPVGEEVSQVYSDPMPSFDLTIPMRNAGQPALQAICNQFRNTVETQQWNPIQLVPGVIDWLDAEQMEEEVTRLFADPLYNARILTYTNRQAIAYNQFIRDVRGLPGQFQAGEYVVNNSAVRIGKVQLSVEDEVYIRHLSSIDEEYEIVTGASLTIRRAELETTRGEILHDVKIVQDRDHYTQLIKYFAKCKNWERYFFLKGNFPDLRQRDACTTYKAQGSTMHTTYIDLTDFSQIRHPAQAARSMYVAVSRPTDRIVFFGELAPKYGELIL
jgi:hypothetical protein